MEKKHTRPSSNFNDRDAKAFIIELFAFINSSKTIQDLELIPKKINHGHTLQKKMPGENFPRLRLKITDEDIKTLKEIGAISENKKLTLNLANDGLEDGKKMSALEKLLYSMLWKNGDLGKEHHLISGILGGSHYKKFGTVFYEFGGYLAGKHSYILDQHTLRCFAVRAASDNEISTARNLDQIDGTDAKCLELIKSYREFYKDIILNVLCDQTDYLYMVDRLLFAAGKLVKTKKAEKI